MTNTENITFDANAGFIDTLRELIADNGGNKHDTADLIILVCLEEGIRSGAEIRRIGVALGLDGSHMSIRMKVGVENGWWRRDADGSYSHVPNVALPGGYPHPPRGP